MNDDINVFTETEIGRFRGGGRKSNDYGSVSNNHAELPHGLERNMKPRYDSEEKA